jgi:hypothetical protein
VKKLVDIDADAIENTGVGISQTGRQQMTIPITDTVAHLCLSSKINPTIKCKIYAFRAVEAKVETRVVPSWERYDKLASILDESVGTTRCFGKHHGRREITLVPKELRAPRGFREMS